MSAQTDKMNAFFAQSGGSAAPAAPVEDPNMTDQQRKLAAYDVKEAETRKANLAPRADRVAEQNALRQAENAELTGLSGSVLKDTLAGIGSGMLNVWEGASNMLLPKTLGASDERIRERNEIDKAGGLEDSWAGKGGKFVGEMAALAPLGALGKGVQLAGQATKLPTAMKILGAATEGAVGGAMISDPNERGAGALLGAGLGGTLSGVGAAGSRFFKDGLVKMRKPAQDAIEYMTDAGVKRKSLPLTLGADPAAGGTSAKGAAIADIMSLMPSAKGAVDSQIDDVATDLFEADLRTAFKFNKGVSDRAVKVLRETGDMQKAIEAGMGKKGYLPREAHILNAAARNAPEGRYTGKQLEKAAKDAAGDNKLTGAPFIDAANTRMKLLPRGDSTVAGQSTVFSRDAVRGLGDLIGKTVDLVPFLGPSISTPGFQNFLMGNTWAQRGLKNALATNNGKRVREVISQIRRAMAAQGGDATHVDQVAQTVGAEDMVGALRGN